jgi:hypothetical protein
VTLAAASDAGQSTNQCEPMIQTIAASEIPAGKRERLLRTGQRNCCTRASAAITAKPQSSDCHANTPYVAQNQHAIGTSSDGTRKSAMRAAGACAMSGATLAAPAAAARDEEIGDGRVARDMRAASSGVRPSTSRSSNDSTVLDEQSRRLLVPARGGEMQRRLLAPIDRIDVAGTLAQQQRDAPACVHSGGGPVQRRAALEIDRLHRAGRGAPPP